MKKYKLSFVFALINLFQFEFVDAQLRPAAADSFLHFIQANKDRSSLYMTRNDTIIAYLNESQLMPLAGTMQILLAIEFAKQSGDAIIDKNNYVLLSELEKYYLPGTLDASHLKWVDYVKKNNLVRNESVKLIDVARGMMMFNSMANSEYLLDLLGINNVKSNISLFSLKNHTDIYALPASLLLFQNPKNISDDKILKAILKMSPVQYCKYITDLHVQLKNNKAFKVDYRPQDLTLKMQQVWSSRLPASTTKDYLHLANILNNRKFLNDSAYDVIEKVLEFAMENNAFRSVFKQYGVKGGNTPFALTHVIYFTTNTNIKMEMAIFLDGLIPEESRQLQGWLDAFESQVIFDGEFRKKLNFQ